MSKPKAQAKPAKSPKRSAKLGEMVFYFPTPEEQRANQQSKVLPAIVVNTDSSTGICRLTVFTDAERNLWVRGIKPRTDISQTGVYDFNSSVEPGE